VVHEDRLGSIVDDPALKGKRPMTYFQSDDFNPENLERVVRESEESIRRLTAASRELEELTGTGRSAGELVGAEVDSGGGLRRVDIDPRAMRLGSHELAEQVCQAVRAAQADVQRRGQELLADALGDDVNAAGTAHLDLARLDRDLDAMHRQARDVQESFRSSMEQRLSTIDGIVRREW
jgi:DNA-binding protein YbaB